jgi:type I restriction enzyme R subunit
MTPQPEIIFQKHITDFLVHEHSYGVLEQEEIADPEWCIADDHLWAFLTDSQPDTLQKLVDDYGPMLATRSSAPFGESWATPRFG